MADPMTMSSDFDPGMVNITAGLESDNPDDFMNQVYCAVQLGENEYNGNIGARISSIFVILICSSACTFFPVVATRVRRLRINLYVYLFARYFGSGVIVATAFIHLLDPAYNEIGPYSCVGTTAGWREYSWVPAITLFSVFVIFFMDFGAERYVETKYGLPHEHQDLQEIVAGDGNVRHRRSSAMAHEHHDHSMLHSADQRDNLGQTENGVEFSEDTKDARDDERAVKNGFSIDEASISSKEIEQSFTTQIAAFLILEFGVIFHSVIIGLNLGTAGDEFSTLYVVLVFHQSFEGLGVGARLSTIPFPRGLRWMPWALCAAYGLTTPIAIAIGLGVRNTYAPESFTANVVSGVLDSISAGILIYTGLVELLARDFLYDPKRTRDNRRLTFMMISVILGAGLMALLGKWA